MQDLIAEGAQNILFVGLPPMGCLPLVITTHSDCAIQNRNCVENISSPARSFNEELQNQLNAVRRANIKIAYADIYNPMDDMIKNPSKYGQFIYISLFRHELYTLFACFANYCQE